MLVSRPDSRDPAWVDLIEVIVRLRGLAWLALAIVFQSMAGLAQDSGPPSTSPSTGNSPSTSAPSPAPPDLTQASLEDLLKMQVTSVSKKSQSLSRAGAAVFVITQEDIRRSGATNLPDVLRLAPGVNVARVNTSNWAVSIRGFNDVYADKVLVLIDGRSVYNPVFSGVLWDAQNVPLEDIERIEVIRGPGGTVWGANAMNGVINIITKNTKDMQGGLVTAGGGSETYAGGLAQYSGAIGSKGTYRVFGQYSDLASAPLPSGENSGDGSQSYRTGFRSDWNLTPRDTMTVQGDFQQSREGENITTIISDALPSQRTFTQRVEDSGANVLGRWNHVLDGGSEVSFQLYDDYSRNTLDESLWQNTTDHDFQDHVAFGTRQDIVWGLGARLVAYDLDPGYSLAFQPAGGMNLLSSTFVQDEVKISNGLSLIIGSKFEHNAYTGFEFEPSAQLVWNPTARQSFWLSAARAIRQPTRSTRRFSMTRRSSLRRAAVSGY